MFELKKILIASILVVLFMSTPVAARAQSIDQVRQALLVQLISLLEMQLELLQAQLVEELVAEEENVNYPIDSAVFYDDDSFLESIDAEIIARYRIDNMDIDSPSRTHERYIDRMAALLPEAYHQYFVELVVFESGRGNVDAFVETTLPYDEQWRYGVNQEVFTDPIDSILNSELLVHEFAHIFSLHEVFTSSRPNVCHEFFAESGCVAGDTIYGKFLDEFWTDTLLDRAVEIQNSRNATRAIDRFYDTNKDTFVSSYAASSPAEDFAESFAHFVLFDDESFGTIASEKIQFFNRFSKTRVMKEEIQADL